MSTPILSPKPMSGWKRIALRSLFGGAGFALMLSFIVGGIAWYSSRPKPPKPWDSNALVAKEPPSFSLSKDGGKMEFRYALENTTDTDYQIDSDAYFKVMVKNKEGTFSQPLSKETASLALPVFVPAKQKAFVRLSVAVSNVPARNVGESEDDYHERLRGYLEEHWQAIANFVVFEELNHYQINLPRWLPKSKEK